jgi:hypothetical protein
MKTPYYVKQLRLVPPERAASRGLQAEGPLFVSPYVEEPRRCDLPSCQAVYRPLSFQVGYITTAHHHHFNTGGIYVYLCARPRLPLLLGEQTGWSAHVDPLGEVICSNDGTGRAPAVRCEAIDAYCMAHELAVRWVSGSRHRSHPIRAGWLFAYPSDMRPPLRLLPVCEETAIPLEYASLRFQLREGQAFFTKRS